MIFFGSNRISIPDLAKDFADRLSMEEVEELLKVNKIIEQKISDTTDEMIFLGGMFDDPNDPDLWVPGIGEEFEDPLEEGMNLMSEQTDMEKQDLPNVCTTCIKNDTCRYIGDMEEFMRCIDNAKYHAPHLIKDDRSIFDVIMMCEFKCGKENLRR